MADHDIRHGLGPCGGPDLEGEHCPTFYDICHCQGVPYDTLWLYYLEDGVPLPAEGAD